MPRPQPQMITFTIDGREVQAAENTMLVDAAKHGDVEIPVFCYEPKLGQPVGACRMCLVEVEGIPKLQTGCSTPVKDGMVVHTQSERVKTAQQSVVEFLLINHPLDCPVCDKGGECPLQDITFGWGGGISRFIEPKRHFVKPLALSPLIAIDRERCILCYRCVRFSQEVSEDYQLVLLERGAHSYVSTFDGHPYVAPFSGNIVELCPVGALTSRPYRFRARPWDIEGAGSVCTLCPAQCNVTLTVRDERALRVLARENDEVDDGWLCDKGRFAYQSFHVEQRITEPLVRDGGELRPVSWERALEAAASGLRRAGAGTGAIVGGQSSSEEGHLLARLLREGLQSPHIDSRRAGTLALERQRALGAPALQARTSDLEFAHAVLVLDTEPVNDAPIFDLRLRKGIRRHGLKLAVASPYASSLDAGAALSLRYAPGAGAAFAAALAAALNGAEEVDQLAAAAGADAAQVGELAALLRGPETDAESAPREVVVLWGERLTAGAGGDAGAGALLSIAAALELAANDGAGLLEVPSASNGRGLREAGALPNAGAGLAEPEGEGRDAHAIAEGLAAGELSALYVLHGDPLRDLPDGELWRRAMSAAGTMIAHASFLTEGIAEFADVVFPAEVYAEKEGTIVHPDGRLQRLRPAIARVGEIRAEWQVLAELAARVGFDLEVESALAASEQLFTAVPFYAGVTLEEIGGRGVRWQEREPAARFPAPGASAAAPARDDAADGNEDGVELAGYRSVWDAPEVEFSPALEFLFPRRELVQLSILATVGYYEEWWIQVLKAIVIFAVGLQLVPIVLLAERKLLGRFQARYGPNRVGPYGAMQPLADILKLLTKEQFRPTTSAGLMFAIAPILSILTAVAAFAIIPFGNTQDIFGTEVGLYGIDVSIGPLYVFAFGGIAFYGIMLGGWSSGSKYSFLGAMRGAAQLISYEVSQGLALVGVVMTAQTLSLTGIVDAQEGMWFIVPQFVGFLIFLTASFAETNRAPFDLTEADAELVGGYNTEYGGGRFASYYFAEYLNVLVVSGIVTTVFLGGWLLPFGIHPPGWVDPFVVLFKMGLITFLFIWVRATLPRLRYDQLMSFGWKVLLPLATLNTLVTAILVVSTH